MIGAILATMSAGLNVASAIGNYNASKQKVKQLRQQAKIAAENRADEISALAATQRVRYLSAGLELEGTPQAVMTDTYNTGIADIQAIRDSYNTEIKNVKTQARAQLLGGLASAATSLYGAFGTGGTDTSTNTADAATGAINSGGRYIGLSGNIPVYDVSGTAQTRGNVRMVNGFYSG